MNRRDPDATRNPPLPPDSRLQLSGRSTASRYPDTKWPGRPPMAWESAFNGSLTAHTDPMARGACGRGSPYRQGRPPAEPLGIGIANLWRYYADPCPRDYGSGQSYERRVSNDAIDPDWMAANFDVGGESASPYSGRYMREEELNVLDKVFGVSNWGEG